MPLSPQKLIEHIARIAKFHSELPLMPENAFRNWDGKTPFYVHPIWCALTIMAETKLPVEIRDWGALVLLYHDVPEDTHGILPDDLPPDVVAGIKLMTCEQQGGREKIWKQPKQMRLLKLYDKTNNMMDWYVESPEAKRASWDFVHQLIDDVGKNYGKLDIMGMAISLVSKLG